MVSEKELIKKLKEEEDKFSSKLKAINNENRIIAKKLADKKRQKELLIAKKKRIEDLKKKIRIAKIKNISPGLSRKISSSKLSPDQKRKIKIAAKKSYKTATYLTDVFAYGRVKADKLRRAREKRRR